MKLKDQLIQYFTQLMSGKVQKLQNAKPIIFFAFWK